MIVWSWGFVLSLPGNRKPGKAAAEKERDALYKHNEALSIGDKHLSQRNSLGTGTKALAGHEYIEGRLDEDF